MKILFIAHRVPVPPDKGEKIRAFHQLCYLGRSHEVDLLALADDRSDLAHLHLLEGVCRRVEVVRQTGFQRLLASLVALLRGEAISVASFASTDLARLARRWQHETRYDVVLAFSSTMAQYVARDGATFQILDMVDVDSAKWEQYAQETKGPLRWVYGREGRLVAAWEAEVARRFDVTTFVSRSEAAFFQRRVPDARNVRVIDNGVREQFFEHGWCGMAGRSDYPLNVAFMGTMDYRPNVDGVQWFVGEVLPRVERVVKEVAFTVIGGRPTAAVRHLGQRRGVRVTGFVPDLLAELNSADIFVAPLRIARGVQNKVLEALAYGLPVVATPQALEGIDAEPGEHLLVAADAQEFAAAVVELLQRPDAARVMGQAARRHMARRYQWNLVLEPLGELFSERAKAVVL